MQDSLSNENDAVASDIDSVAIDSDKNIEDVKVASNDDDDTAVVEEQDDDDDDEEDLGEEDEDDEDLGEEDDVDDDDDLESRGDFSERELAAVALESETAIAADAVIHERKQNDDTTGEGMSTDKDDKSTTEECSKKRPASEDEEDDETDNTSKGKPGPKKRGCGPGSKKGRQYGCGGPGKRGGRTPSVAGIDIPFRTVKKAMKHDRDIPIVQNEAAIMATMAAELFLKQLATTAYTNAKNHGRNTVRYEDIAEARADNQALDFLEPLLP